MLFDRNKLLVGVGEVAETSEEADQEQEPAQNQEVSPTFWGYCDFTL